MATTTLIPNGTVSSSGPSFITIEGGSATVHAALSDNSDATDVNMGVSWVALLDLSTFSFPALSQIRSVTPRLRTNTAYGFIQLRDVSGNTKTANNVAVVGSTVITYTGAAEPTNFAGAAWTQADIDALRVAIWNGPTFTGRYHDIFVDVVYNEAPVVSAITPSGTYTLGAQPGISWTYVDPEADAQERYRVKIYAGTGTVADPDNTAALVDSGEVFSAGVYSLPQALAAGSYRIYVKAADVGSNGRYSAWATTTLTIQIDAPATPTVTATPDSTLARIGVLVQGSDNLLTYDQASMETSITGWYQGTSNPTLARSTAQFLHGAASLSMTATAAATMAAQTGQAPGGPFTPVVAGVTYTAMASFRAATTARTVQVQIAWYNVAGSLLSTTSGTGVSDSNSAWTQATASGAAPAGATRAIVIVSVASAANGEVHYVDQVGIRPSASTTWTAGGKTDVAAILVERSIDGGITWAPVRGAPGTFFGPAVWDSSATQQFSLYDYEVARNVSVQYRARVLAQLPYVASSAAGTSSTVSHAATGWWLKDPLAPGLNHQPEVIPPFDYKRKNPSKVYDPLGRATSVVVSDGVKGIQGALNVRTQLKARYDKLEAILAPGRTLWLEDVLGRSWYIDVSDDFSWSWIKAQPAVGETTPLRHFHEVALPFVQVGSPTGDTVTAGTPTP